MSGILKADREALLAKGGDGAGAFVGSGASNSTSSGGTSSDGISSNAGWIETSVANGIHSASHRAQRTARPGGSQVSGTS